MSLFPAIRIEGGLLGPDTLEQLLAGDLPGQRPQDFGLDDRRSLTDEIASVFADARAQWEVFRRRLERLPETDPATSVTRDAWMIPFLSLLGYELRYNPRAYEVDGLTFAISHRAGEAEDAPPVHIVGARQELGRLAPTGRPRLAPHSLVQEYLNRTEHLWGLVTNGLTLRLLRDSTYVRRQSYVEFDLQQIFEEQRFGDFVVLYRLLHRSRLPRSAAEARDCWLEQYHQQAVEQGGRVRDRLRDGVEECIKRLANGFLSHPENAELRQRVASSHQRAQEASSEPRAASSEEDIPLAARHSPLADSTTGCSPLTSEELYRQLLRLVYRLLFLLVSEDRGLISADPLYREHYGVARLRRLLDRRSAYTEHDDLWCSLRVLWKVLSDERLAGLLGAAPLNGELFAPLALDHCTITNRDFLEAFWHLAYYRESPSAPPRRVNYAALDVEELGSVYESLLEYHPQIDASGALPRFELALGSERRSTGSYYTPSELVAELIRSALEPVIEERLAEAKRMANGEWRMVPKNIREMFIHEVFSRLSRPGGLAKGDAGGQKGLPAHQGLSPIGTLRPDQPDATGSHLDPGEYRRGLGTSLYSGVHSVSASSEREPDRAGDTSSSERGNQPLLSASGLSDSGRTSGSRQTTEQLRTQPPTEEELALAWRSTPFAIRYSLFAAHALLSVRVLDSACGSGHFLLAAARRLGKELAKVRTGEDEPAPERVREAIRDVVAHCIYGVDKNPLAVELCRVALWLEAHCAGKPLTFLDHRIRCGDSLVGVLDLGVLEAGIPDEAFAPASTDAREAAGLLRKRNRSERRALESGQLRLPLAPERVVDALGARHHDIEAIADDSPAAVREKKSRYDRLLADPARLRIAEACDLWTAAFFQRYTPELATSSAAITTDTVTDRLAGRAHPQALAAARALAERHRFFHWPLEFPDVFAEGGFDVVLSNPPWERIKLQEQEFFAARDTAIAGAPNAAARKRLIARVEETNSALWQEYQEALHDADATSKFLRTSGRYPLTGRGDINTYAVFTELAWRLLNPRGRAGLVVPTGIATDDTTKHLFGALVAGHALVSLYDFENREGLFPGVHRSYKFCLLTLAHGGLTEPARFAFFLHRAEQLREPERVFSLSPEDFALINPNTRTCPIFRSSRDAELTRAIYQRVPVLVRADDPAGNPWGVEFLRMFDMANDSGRFRTRKQLEAAGYRLAGNVFTRAGAPARDSSAHPLLLAGEAGRGEEGPLLYLPLYEAKLAHQFDHRWASYGGPGRLGGPPEPGGPPWLARPPRKDDDAVELTAAAKADPELVVLPRYWVAADVVEAELAGRWERGWLLGWRDITNATNERTVIAAVIPRVAVGNKIPLILLSSDTIHLGFALICPL